MGQTRTSSLGAARPLPPSADIGPGGQSVGQAAQFCLGPGRSWSTRGSWPRQTCSGARCTETPRNYGVSLRHAQPLDGPLELRRGHASLLLPIHFRRSGNSRSAVGGWKDCKRTHRRTASARARTIPASSKPQKHLAKMTAEAKRLNDRNEARSQAGRTMSHTLSNVEPWLRDGKPSGAVLEQFDGPEPQLLKGKRRNFSPAKAWP